MIVVRGGGDLATGVVKIIHDEGFEVLVTEIAQPRAVRRVVSLCEAVYEGTWIVDNLTARLVADPVMSSIEEVFVDGHVPVVVDEFLTRIDLTAFRALVDARMLKQPPGARPEVSGPWIGLGPGFDAGNDVDAVIETHRGPNLGDVIQRGGALPNTGVPGEVGGETILRLVSSPIEGVVEAVKEIGALVEKGDPLCVVRGSMRHAIVPSPLAGKVRGLIRDGTLVHEGEKIGDVDPRGDGVDHRLISDKALAVGRGVLRALDILT